MSGNHIKAEEILLYQSNTPKRLFCNCIIYFICINTRVFYQQRISVRYQSLIISSEGDTIRSKIIDSSRGPFKWHIVTWAFMIKLNDSSKNVNSQLKFIFGHLIHLTSSCIDITKYYVLKVLRNLMKFFLVLYSVFYHALSSTVKCKCFCHNNIQTCFQ